MGPFVWQSFLTNRKMKMNKLMTNINTGFMLLVAIIILNNCHRKTGIVTYDETPTRGNIRIGVDESFKLLMDTEIYTFTSIYNYAKITPEYKPETDILNEFMKDSLRVIFTSKKLDDAENQFLKSKQIITRSTTIAFDALAFIVNNNNKDSLLKYTQIKDLFTGQLKNWKQVSNKNNPSAIKVVFDNIKSGNVRYFVEKYKLPNKLPTNFYAVNSNDEVVNYVEKHPDAIGVISVNWISDKNDSVSNSFLKRFRVVAVSSEFDSEGNNYYRPYQAYIAEKSYPFVREVYAISRESFDGLGSGFIAFVAGEKGQRIILKSKLVPATMPIRLIQIKNQ